MRDAFHCNSHPRAPQLADAPFVFRVNFGVHCFQLGGVPVRLGALDLERHERAAQRLHRGVLQRLAQQA